MKFILTVAMDNAAFDGCAAEELARILSDVAENLRASGDVPQCFQTIRDVNGNRVGQYAAKPSDYE